ncbi:MAG: glycosyltransferase [Nitrospirae bacterium]|nr:glycosyltransferase [Nitrospirota bacterium]
MNKKVLIITYFFPPRTDIGSQRPYRLAKYLSKFGWTPVVLTAKLPGKAPEGIRVIETGYRDMTGFLKSKIGINPKKGLHEQLGIAVSKNFHYPTWKSKIIKLMRESINFPDDRIGWYKYALQSAHELLSRETIDIMISTSSPVTSHLVAAELKQQYKIPWIADFRDPWTQSAYYNKFPLIKYFERRLELKTLSKADAVVTVTRPWIDMLKTLYKDKTVFCVTNGFDEDDRYKQLTRLTNNFTITYTGILYDGKRDPSLLFKAVRQLIDENKINKDLIEVKFFCPKEDWLTEDIKNYNLEKVVNVYGFLPREEILKKQRESQLLLLLLWDNKGEEGFCPAKIYEYFAAGRPIIAVGGGGGFVKELLEETNTGKHISTLDNLKNVLLRCYEEYVNCGEVKYNSNKNINNYTYYSIANRYSGILNKIA